MLEKTVLKVCLLFFCVTFVASAETLDVSLRIRNDKSDEKIINRENLLKIKTFMIKNDFHETYCQAYNNNYAYLAKRFAFYLNPGDTLEKKVNEMDESVFQTLVIRDPNNNRNQYCYIQFDNEYEIDIRIPVRFPKSNVDLTATEIREFASEAIQEILAEINKDTPAPKPQPKITADTGNLQEAINIAIPALYKDKMTQSFNSKLYILTSAQQIPQKNKWIWLVTFKPKELLPDDLSKEYIGFGGEVFVNVDLNTKETIITYGE